MKNSEKQMEDEQIENSHCGCCGREKIPARAFCADCDRHVLQTGAMWKRTYFHQHRTACPFQVPELNLLENDELCEMAVNKILGTLKI